MTTVSIVGEKVYIDGKPTYAGRTFEGHPVEGLLFNVRAVQATFDDTNPATRDFWKYPDTGKWDPERNVTEFMAALPTWRDHGVLGFTINFQGGGSRYVPEIYQNYENSGFTRQGEIKPEYADRISRILARADELGMVVFVGMYYWIQTNKMESEEATWHAIDNALAFLKNTGRKNFMIELANETNYHFTFPNFHLPTAHKMVEHFKAKYPEMLITTSLVGANLQTGQGLPTPELVKASDFILIHGNGTRPEQLGPVLDWVKAMPEFKENPKPVIINEDSTGIPNLECSWKKFVSWGYYDQGYNGEPRQHDIWISDMAEHTREDKVENLSGYQTVPVNWTINTPRKKAFFSRVAEITGYKQG